MDSLRGVGKVFTQAAEQLKEGIKTLNKVMAPKVHQGANVQTEDKVITEIISKQKEQFSNALKGADLKTLKGVLRGLESAIQKPETPTLGGTEIPLTRDQMNMNKLNLAKQEVVNNRIAELEPSKIFYYSS